MGLVCFNRVHSLIMPQGEHYSLRCYPTVKKFSSPFCHLRANFLCTSHHNGSLNEFKLFCKVACYAIGEIKWQEMFQVHKFGSEPE